MRTGLSLIAAATLIVIPAAAADWQQVRDQTRAALDRLLSLAEAAGPWSWLAGGTLLAVAAEVVRRRRAARARRSAPARWPEVIAPNGLV